MPISAEGKVGYLLAFVALCGTGSIMVWPQHLEIGWSLIAIGLLGIASLAAQHIREVGVPFSRRRVPLAQAAAELYGEMRGTEWARFNEQSARDQAEILDRVGHHIALNVAMCVRRPPSPKREIMDRNELARMGVAAGATEIRYHGRKTPEFVDPSVLRRELRALIRDLKAEYPR